MGAFANRAGLFVAGIALAPPTETTFSSPLDPTSLTVDP
jgi:hypothetical protein